MRAPCLLAQVNNPPCSGCSNSETVPAGMGRPSEDDTAAGAGRVELYNCPGCGTQTRSDNLVTVTSYHCHYLGRPLAPPLLPGPT